MCNDITCHSSIYLKFHTLFPKNQRGKQLSWVLLVCYSIRLQLECQYEDIVIAFNVAVLCMSCLKLTNTLLLGP